MILKFLALFRKEQKPTYVQNVENVVMDFLNKKDMKFEMMTNEESNVFFNVITEFNFGKAYLHLEVLNNKKCVRISASPDIKIPEYQKFYVPKLFNYLNEILQFGKLNYFFPEGDFNYQISFGYIDKSSITVDLLEEYFNIVTFYTEKAFDELFNDIYEKTASSKAKLIVQKQTNSLLN